MKNSNLDGSDGYSYWKDFQKEKKYISNGNFSRGRLCFGKPTVNKVNLIYPLPHMKWMASTIK